MWDFGLAIDIQWDLITASSDSDYEKSGCLRFVPRGFNRFLAIYSPSLFSPAIYPFNQPIRA
jgi:hypothetical protein